MRAWVEGRVVAMGEEDLVENLQLNPLEKVLRSIAAQFVERSFLKARKCTRFRWFLSDLHFGRTLISI